MTPNMVVMAPWVIGMPRAYILSLTRSLTCDTKEAVINKRILEDYNISVCSAEQCSKIGKKCNLKSTKKTTFFAISKMAKKKRKFFFAPEKFKTTKNAFFWCKNWFFFPIFEIAKICVCVLLKLHFFPILEQCAGD